MDDFVTRCSSVAPLADDGTARQFDPAWRSETVLVLARAIEAENAYDRMPILADELEEAGCDDEVLLRHCRECERHEAGCWVIAEVTRQEESEPPEPFPYLSTYARREAEARLTSGLNTGSRILNGHLVAKLSAVVMIGYFVLLIAKYLGRR